nr:TetR/AcrR family transcriptional regulator [Melghirimyces profundicolus]
MSRKEIQTKRMWMYFVNATVEIIEKEGIEGVTARKIADRAGYTSSTIYNYFGELSHLIFFASMRFVNDYIQEVPTYMSKGVNYLEKYLLSWECLCKHSFTRPEIYHAVFIANLGGKPQELLDHYYSVYQSDLIGFPDDLKPLILEHNLIKRNQALLEMASKENIVRPENIEEVNDIIILIWEGMITTLLNQRRDYELEEAIEKTMRYINKIASKLL